ncbi:MAG: hypothetical protein PHV74_06750 [Dehalococcoidia bacterium]|nr:hypothetical protein [Dehalococcoidia bacterium]
MNRIKGEQGRPYSIAILDDEESRVDIIEEFYSVIDRLSHREKTALARALYRQPRTVVIAWTYRTRFPGIEVAKRVIEWDKKGRPLTTRKCRTSYIDAV